MLMLTDTLTHLPTLAVLLPAYEALKAYFTRVPGFDAYDAAKWAQRAERACHGDRQALAQLDAAGFSLMVTTRL